MRTALLVALLGSHVALAQQAISGTYTATFEGFDQYGGTKVRLKLDLTCSLSCPPSAPQLHYGVYGGVGATFVNAPEDSAAYISSGFGGAADGHNEYVNTDFDPGSYVVSVAKSATCWCGNRTGEGGYIDLSYGPFAVPPYVFTSTPQKAGREDAVIINAVPKGAETVTVQLKGAGLDETRVLTPADFGTAKSTFVRFTAKQAGALVITATLQPPGASDSKTVDVPPADSTGTGGGSSGGTGGGGGSDEPAPEGCSTAAAGPLALAALLALRRRAR